MADRKEVIHRNLSLVFDKKLSFVALQKMVEKNLSNLARRQRFLEQLSVIRLEEIERFVPEVEGDDNLKNALEADRGVILFSMHFFCCDLGLILLSYEGFRVNLVFDSTEEAGEGPSLLEDTFEGKGINLIKSARSFKIKTKDKEYVFRDRTFQEIVSRLKKNEVVAMLPDMHPGAKAKGVYVQFLGLPTYVGYAPILIARRTGAKMVPALVVPTDEGAFKGIIHPALSMIESKDKHEFYRLNMQQYMDIVESYVLKYPEEYCWHQPGRWEE